MVHRSWGLGYKHRLPRIGSHDDCVGEQHLDHYLHGRDNIDYARFLNSIGQSDISAGCSGNDNPNRDHDSQLPSGHNYGDGMQQDRHGDGHVNRDDGRSDHGHNHCDHDLNELRLHDHSDHLRSHHKHDNGHAGRWVTLSNEE